MLAGRLREKKQELRELQNVQQVSKDLVSELETLATNLSTLSDGTEVVANLMANWTGILKNLQLASTSLTKYSESDYKQDSEVPAEERPLPETLVRIRVDDKGDV